MLGVILFAHGARDPAWSRPFELIAERLRAQSPNLPVALAYLEFMSPDLGGAVLDLKARGCTQVSIVPMFLGAGGHVRRDLPQWIDTLRKQHPDLRIDATPALGEAPVAVQALAGATLALVQGLAP